MPASPSMRRFLAVLCIVAVLLAVLTVGAGGHAPAILSTFVESAAPDPGAPLAACERAPAPSRSPHAAAAPRAPPIA